MELWKARVITEKDKLDRKIRTLNAFISDPEKTREVKHAHFCLLTKQLKAMTKYSNILNSRILTFPPVGEEEQRDETTSP